MQSFFWALARLAGSQRAARARFRFLFRFSRCIFLAQCFRNLEAVGAVRDVLMDCFGVSIGQAAEHEAS
jgi:hypothetical protein